MAAIVWHDPLGGLLPLGDISMAYLSGRHCPGNSSPGTQSPSTNCHILRVPGDLRRRLRRRAEPHPRQGQGQGPCRHGHPGQIEGRGAPGDRPAPGRDARKRGRAARQRFPWSEVHRQCRQSSQGNRRAYAGLLGRAPRRIPGDSAANGVALTPDDCVIRIVGWVVASQRVHAVRARRRVTI